jgi:TrpR-related protein YerC/YecD
MEKFESKLKNKNADFLCDAVLTLNTREECYRFFEDIFTINEVKAIEQRLNVAKLLSQKCTYSIIGEETGASTATISRVNRCLNYGSDGYNTVLKRLSVGENKEK